MTHCGDVGSRLKAEAEPAGGRARTPRTAAAKDFRGGGAYGSDQAATLFTAVLG
jgi:hypothetical protein